LIYFPMNGEVHTGYNHVSFVKDQKNKNLDKVKNLDINIDTDEDGYYEER